MLTLAKLLTYIGIAWDNFSNLRAQKIRKQQMVFLYFRVCVLLKMRYKRDGYEGIYDRLRNRIKYAFTFVSLNQLHEESSRHNVIR